MDLHLLRANESLCAFTVGLSRVFLTRSECDYQKNQPVAMTATDCVKTRTRDSMVDTSCRGTKKDSRDRDELRRSEPCESPAQLVTSPQVLTVAREYIPGSKSCQVKSFADLPIKLHRRVIQRCSRKDATQISAIQGELEPICHFDNTP